MNELSKQIISDLKSGNYNANFPRVPKAATLTSASSNNTLL